MKMKISQKHQEILDGVHPDGYPTPEGLDGSCFHIMYVDIVKDGKWKRGVPVFQKYRGSEWLKTKAVIEKFGIEGATGHDEYTVVHDPAEAEKEAKAAAIRAEQEEKERLAEAEQSKEAAIGAKKKAAVAKAKATRDKNAKAKAESTAANG